MKAAVYAENGVLEVVQRETPEPRPGWVRVAVSAVGICGTDLHMQRGSFGKVQGVQPGHEIAGVLDAVGDAVGDRVKLATGSLVAIEPVTSCGQCFHCRTGSNNRCAASRLFGVTARGGMADYVAVPASCVYPLAAGLSANVAALAEPAAVCARGVRLGQVTLNDCVAVLGAGTIGLLSIVIARASGAGEVFVTARHPHQAALARHFGATEVFPSSAALMQAVGDDTVDVVIETVGGTSTTLSDSVHLVRRGGRIVMLGVFDGSPGIPGLAFSTKELTLVGSNCYGHGPHLSDFALGTQIIDRHRDVLSALVTHRFKLDQVAAAFATATDKASGSIKVQIEP